MLQPDLIHIYIPLWSYSNNELSAFQKYLNPYLHSTMVLFKWIPTFLLSLKNSKFTFHYGPIQMKKIKKSLDYTPMIYIPLWSYSNKCDEFIKIVKEKFTFHYGPIQMKTISRTVKKHAPFTFHYGPIQIVLDYRYIRGLQYLHSTMVLFKFDISQ